ncbi:MAG: hypothetical protein ACK5M7_02635 [Draconibacterium sp.]
MKPLLLTLAMLVISQVIIAQTNHNSGTNTENGLTSIVFETPEGEVTTYLPANLHSGDIISGTVIAEPKGSKAKQISKNHKVLNGYVIEIEGESVPVEKQKLSWQLPVNLSEEIVRLILRDTDGKELGAASLPVDPEPRISIPVLHLARNDFHIPELLRSGETEMIPGKFDGRADNTGLKMNAQNVDIVAESPEGLFLKVPEDVSGTSTLQLTEGEMQFEEEVNIADLHLSANKLTLAKGEKTKVSIAVTGLQQIEKPVDIDVRNLSPSVITIEGGNEQTLHVNPDQVSHGGSFNTGLAIQASRSGSFSVMAKIAQPASAFIKILSPTNSEEVPPGSLEIRWEGFGMAPATQYQVKVYYLGEDYIENQEELYSKEPVFIKENIQTTSLYSGELNRVVSKEGNYALAIDAFDAVSGDRVASGSEPFFLISNPKCRCTSTYGNKVFANVLKNNQVIGFVELGSQPSLVELPEGPLTLRFTGTDINCGECSNVECDVNNVTYVPALLVINPNETRQTVEVRVSWQCESNGCEPVECSDTYKFKFKQAKDDCYCGDISLDVEVVNVNAKDPLKQNSRSTFSSHRTAGSSGQEIINMSDDGLRFDNKDIIEIRISNINTKCWCESGLCDPTASDDKDERAGRPHSVKLGENDADASNDNCNLVRVKDDNAGWQSNGDYVIKARIENAGLLVREIYQDFKIRYWCESDDCTKSLCDKNFRLVFGKF